LRQIDTAQVTTMQANLAADTVHTATYCECRLQGSSAGEPRLANQFQGAMSS